MLFKKSSPLQEELRVTPPHYNYVQPSEFYSGLAPASLGTDTANLQLLSAYNMQHLHPSLQHLHPTFQSAIFQQQSYDSVLQQHAHMQPTHAPGLNVQYARHPSNMHGYSGSMASSDGMYGLLGMFGHHGSQPHQPSAALGLATVPGTATGADSNDTPNSTGTVTGHPSIFRQSSRLPVEQQTSQDKEALQPVSCEPFLECSEHTADDIEQK